MAIGSAAKTSRARPSAYASRGALTVEVLPLDSGSSTPSSPTMPRRFVFADEASCFTFNREPNVSKYFILCTVVMENCAAGTELVNLRRELAWDGFELGDYFHATKDKQAVRDRVYAAITRHPFTVQATIMEKSKDAETFFISVSFCEMMPVIRSGLARATRNPVGAP